MRNPRDRGRGTGGYCKLLAWQAGMDLVRDVYHLTISFPSAERFGLTSQMLRAAVSIPSNLAEGNERSERADRRRFVIMARSSVAELETQTEIAVRLEFVSATDAEPIFVATDVIGRMITKLRRTLDA